MDGAHVTRWTLMLATLAGTATVLQPQRTGPSRFFLGELALEDAPARKPPPPPEPEPSPYRAGWRTTPVLHPSLWRRR
jgi:hypothetical protein